MQAYVFVKTDILPYTPIQIPCCSGTIPDAWGSLLGLQQLDLTGNAIQGTIPGFLILLPQLKNALLAFNQLSGPLPNTFATHCLPVDGVLVSNDGPIFDLQGNAGLCGEY